MAQEPLDQVEAWKKQGALLREKLEKELEAARRRVEEVTAAIRTLPREFASNKGKGEEKKASISSMILDAVRKRPGISAGDVVASVLATRDDAKAKTIHAILYRLRVDGKVAARGERGEMTYYPAEAMPGGDEKRHRGTKPFKASAAAFLLSTPGLHTVAEVARAIDCTNMAQTRNILVRLHNEGLIRRVEDGRYERVVKRESEVRANEGR